jgi:hypothetical protein
MKPIKNYYSTFLSLIIILKAFLFLIELPLNNQTVFI